MCKTYQNDGPNCLLSLLVIVDTFVREYTYAIIFKNQINFPSLLGLLFKRWFKASWMSVLTLYLIKP